MLAEMQILNMQGKLTPAQAAFLAPTKPEFELFDLRQDPHEINNLADDPKYADTKVKLLAKLNDWRTNVIKDQGVSAVFRASNSFPETCPNPTVDEWMKAHEGSWDFNTIGWPAWYPTRPLSDWQVARDLWEPWVFREPTAKMGRPAITIQSKQKKKTNR